MNFLLRRLKHWQIWLAAVVMAVLLTLVITSLVSLLLRGEVARDYLITGMVTSLIVASVVSGVIIVFLHKLTRLHRDNDLLHAIVEACPIPMALSNADGRIFMLNAEFISVYGYTSSDVPSLSEWWSKACPEPDYRNSVVGSWNERLEAMHASGGAFESMEVKIRCKNGTSKIALASANSLGKLFPGLYLLVLYDITMQTESLTELGRSRNILQSVIENIPMRVFWKDLESRYLGCNTAFARDGGEAGPSGIVGKLDTQLTWREQADRYRAGDYDVIQSGLAKLAYDEPQSKPDGSAVWLRTSKVPLRDHKGGIIGVVGVYEDITSRKKIEDELWLTKAILDKSKTAFFRLNASGVVQYVNDYACMSLGYSKDELIGTHPWDFDPDFHATDWPELWRSLVNNEIVQLESRHRRKDGTTFEVDVTGHYIAYQGEEFVFTFVQDISERKAIERALQQKEKYQRALIDNFPFMVWLKDKQSRFLAVNQVLAETLGEKEPDALIGKSDFDCSPKEFAENYRRDDNDVLTARQRKMVEEQHVDHTGQLRWIETFKAPVVDVNGETLGTVGFARDITERKQVEVDLRIAAIAFESQEGMLITDADSVILKINQSFTRITGFTSEDAVGQKMTILKSGIHDAAFYADMWDVIHRTGSWQGEIWNRRKDGELYPEWLTVSAVKDRDGRVTHYVGTMIDITARKAIEERIYHLAHYDPLTDLPNRTLFNDRMHQALAQARRDKSMLALLYLDLDKFKPVNDSLGHDIGDLLLKEVAYRMLKCVKRESDTVSRLGGDEFVVLLSQVEKPENALVVAESILHALSSPFTIEQYTVTISVSIGIALYPLDGADVFSLMRNSDDAMYEAKASGRNQIGFYRANP